MKEFDHNHKNKLLSRILYNCVYLSLLKTMNIKDFVKNQRCSKQLCYFVGIYF